MQHEEWLLLVSAVEDARACLGRARSVGSLGCAHTHTHTHTRHTRQRQLDNDPHRRHVNMTISRYEGIKRIYEREEKHVHRNGTGRDWEKKGTRDANARGPWRLQHASDEQPPLASRTALRSVALWPCLWAVRRTYGPVRPGAGDLLLGAHGGPMASVNSTVTAIIPRR